MARVLVNHHRNVAIEVSRKDKWTTLIMGWLPHKRVKMLNSDVDHEWEEFLGYDVKKVAKQFMKPVNGWVEDSAMDDLKSIVKGAQQ